jgi:hypothetical protein
LNPSNSGSWSCLDPDLESVLARESDPVARLAEGEYAAIIVRGAFPREECQSLVRFLIDQELMFESSDPRILDKAIPANRVDRFTQHGLNPQDSLRKRIDIGTSLGNLGDDQEAFLNHAAQTHELFGRLFTDRPNPIQVIFDNLQKLCEQKRVVTAYEPDGRKYGPAIFRVHYGGYTYGPHFDSVKNREQRTAYAVHQYDHQLAGILCIQNTTINGVTAQGIIHRQLWTPEVDSYIKSSRFDEFKQQNDVSHARVDLEPGDLYFFNTGMIHEVPGVPGDLPRIVLATFIGYSHDNDEIMVWS